MIRLLVSPLSVERRAAAADFIRSLPPGAEALLVGATRQAADELARQAARQSAATWGLERFSVTELASRLALPPLAGQGRAIATPLAMEALAARVLWAAVEAGALRDLTPVARLPGTARALARTLNELRMAKVTPEALQELAGSGRDLAELLSRYEIELSRASLADRPLLLRMATSAVCERDGRTGRELARRYAVGRPMVCLDVAIESAVDRDFIAALAARAPGGLVTVPAGDARSLAAWESIEGVAAEAGPGAARAGSSLERLAHHLFSNAPPGAAPSDGAVQLFSAPGESRESVEIARRILSEARAGVRFDHMAVLLRDPAGYAELLSAAFQRAAIPGFFACGLRRPHPSGRAFLAILAFAAEGFPARRWAEYLSLGESPGLADPEESWPWEQVLVEAAVVRGQDRWARRLNGLEAAWRGRLSRLLERDPAPGDVDGLKHDLARLGSLKEFVLPLIESLAGMGGRARWVEWLDRLQALAPRVLRHPEKVLEVLSELGPLGDAGPVTLREVRDLLEPHLTTFEDEPAGDPYGRVWVGSVEQARGRSFEVVLVPGLAERLFPRRAAEDAFLLDSLRQSLRPGGPSGRGALGLVTADDRLGRERLLLRLAIGSATRRLYLSYPRFEIARARPRVPSFYALDVQRALTGRLPSLEELERDVPVASDAGLAWPAPADPAVAIDAAEHDLAVLGELLRRPEGRARAGRARYLMELNPHLARSLRARWARWSQTWSRYDGLCDPGKQARELLAAHRLTARPYSPSTLQKFAVCPYQFFLSAIHQFAPREESVPLEQMDALTRGHLFHRAQAELGRSLQVGGLPLSASNLDAALQMLDRVLDGEDGRSGIAGEYKERLAPAIERVWKSEVDSVRADLRGWLRWLAEHPDEGGWLPIHFELGIGFSSAEGRDPRSHPDPVTVAGRYQLHGIVDVVERRPRGQGQVELRVTDYKTGRARTDEGLVVGGGEVLQPVLYALAVEAALGQPVVEARLFFATVAGGFSERVVKLDERARSLGVQVLQTIDAAIDHGFLPPAPRPGACSRCDFRLVCGPHEEIRVTRKDASQLGDLLKLRSLP